MSKKIIFSNQKGGVGKTTVCREIGISLAHQGYSVLFIDCDAQGNLTKSLIENPSKGLYEAMTENSLEITPVSEKLSLLSGDIRLSLLEKNLLGEIDGYSRIKEMVETHTLFLDYDYILFDTPPSLGVLTVNALAASDYLIMPVSCRLYSMQGTNDLISSVSKVRKTLNPDLKLLGVIINNFDRVPVIIRQIREEIEDAFGEVVFKEVLSKSIKIEEAIASRQGICELKLGSESRVRQEVAALTGELLSRC